MPDTTLKQVGILIRQQRQALLSRWQREVRKLPSARHLDVPRLKDHIPGFLDELASAFESLPTQSIAEAVAEGGAPAHGLQRLEDDFDIEEVVAEYNILRECLHDLSDENGLTLQGTPFHIINQVLDRAIGSALKAYVTQQALEIARRREEYLAFVAHDLRTPLNAISLASRVLELRAPDLATREETARLLKALRRNVQHLESLVSKVLEENTNLETEAGLKLQRRKIDLWPLVEALILDLYPLAETAHTRLINEVPDDLIIFADASALRRVFQNLIANAIHYAPKGTVRVGAAELSDPQGVECWVSDNGAGIPDELLGKIFDKGESDPQNKEGTGLGLAIVKSFTEAAGGTVAVESQLGVGTTFRFSLPFQSGR